MSNNIFKILEKNYPIIQVYKGINLIYADQLASNHESLNFLNDMKSKYPSDYSIDIETKRIYEKIKEIRNKIKEEQEECQ